MKNGLYNVLRKVLYGIALLFLLSANSCEKKEICMTCYRVDPNGIVLATATQMCGVEGIKHLRDRVIFVSNANLP
jgi:hypothetical protein